MLYDESGRMVGKLTGPFRIEFVESVREYLVGFAGGIPRHALWLTSYEVMEGD